MKKYAYANIKIPIEIKDNNQFEPLKDYIHIEFTPCYELPDKQIDYNGVLQNLNSLFTSTKLNMNTDSEGVIKFKPMKTSIPEIIEEKQGQPPEQLEEEQPPEQLEEEPEPEDELPEETPSREYFVLSNEIKPNKTPKLNLSFKKRTMRNTTAKNR